MDDDQTISSTYLFWQGKAKLHAGSFIDEVNCRLLLDMSANKYTRLEVIEAPPSFINLRNAEQIFVEIPGVTEQINLLRPDVAINSAGDIKAVFRLARSPVWFNNTNTLHSGRTLIINFAHYGIRPTDQWELKGAGWQVRFIALTKDILTIPDSMQSQGYRVTHQAEFSRENLESFTSLDSQTFLEKLHLFLSFCRGAWVATSFALAVDQTGAVGMEQWGIGKVSEWRESSSWLDQHHSEPIAELFGPFLEKLDDLVWKDALSQILYWLERARPESAGVDGACILLQASLERFAWHLLIRDRKTMSANKFNKLPASERLRLLLQALSVPLSIPLGLKNLAAFGMSKELDGPQVFTAIRNKLVHPPLTMINTGKAPYYEAYTLGKWYLELAVLSMCGYRGMYSNRTRADGWIGEVEKVPWA